MTNDTKEFEKKLQYHLKEGRYRIISELEDLLVTEDGIDGKIIKHKHLKELFKELTS